MTRSEKLRAALEILDFKLNKQYSELVTLMQHKIENDKKLQNLIDYRNNYASNNSNKKNQNIANIQIHYKLMSKLESVIESQQRVVQDLEFKVNQRIIALQKDSAQNSALGVLVKRYHQQETAIIEGNEQKELDSQILTMLHNDVMQ